MQSPKDRFIQNHQATVRVTALWACSEAFLGGLLHAVRFPLAGMVLATFASICISVLALCSISRGTILKATLVVIIVKFTLSPHSPILAYLAVAIQGAVGEIVFYRNQNKFSAAFISLFSLMYSAVQQLLIVWILLGKEFYEAFHIYLTKLTQSFLPQSKNIILYIVWMYLIVYFIAGIIAAMINIRIVSMVKDKHIPDYVLRAHTLIGKHLPNPSPSKQETRFSILGIILGTCSLLLLIASSFMDFPIFNLDNKILSLIIRTILLLLVWILLLSPILRMVLSRWVNTHKNRPDPYLYSVMYWMPIGRQIISQSWKSSYDKNKLRHVYHFLVSSILWTVFYE